MPYLCIVYNIKLLTSAYLWVRAPKTWVIDYIQLTNFQDLLQPAIISSLSSSIPLHMIYMGSSQTISVQEGDHAQATVPGPSLFSSLGGCTADIGKAVVQMLILTLQTFQR